MGIPVVFFGKPEETRIHILKQAGIPIHDWRKHIRGLSLLRFTEKAVDWSPSPVDVSDIAARIRTAIADGIRAAA
jgi:hypothetical protein